MPEWINYSLWAFGGAGVGLVLGWWQSRSLKKMEAQPLEKMMGKVYLSSMPRVLMVSALLFLAMTRGVWHGISFAVGFTVSRWIWTFITLRRLKRKDQ